MRACCIFITVPFLAGVAGMNFEYRPELKGRYGYPIFWVVCLVSSVRTLTWFRRRGWLWLGRKRR